jgi:hypothetical protein
MTYSHSRRPVVRPACRQREVGSRSASSATVYSGRGSAASMDRGEPLEDRVVPGVDRVEEGLV